jgi:hypothetical protein
MWCFIIEKKNTTKYAFIVQNHIKLDGLVAHRDQEDRSSKPAWANSSQDPVSKKPTIGGVVQGVGPEFKPQYHKKIH